MQRLQCRLGEMLVFGPLKDQLGLSRMRVALTGGEAMGEDTFLFYRALGINLRQLYGQTESSAFNAVQAADVRNGRVPREQRPSAVRAGAQRVRAIGAAARFIGQ